MINPYVRGTVFGLLALAGLPQILNAQVNKPIKWACIGNSITEGMGSTTHYPTRLATKLGAAYTVENDGVSGTTLLKRGDNPYWKNGKLGNVFALKPDIVTLKLGTNDTKTQNWQYQADFVKDLTAMVDTVANISSHPLIMLCLPCPIFANSFGIRDSILTNSLNARIQQVATAKGLAVIDIYGALKGRSDLFPDGVHPNDAGADSIASIIYRAYLAKAKRVACIGNSITQYVGTISGAAAIDAYPTQLNMLLGRDYYVQNEGVSGAYMQKVSAMPYWTQGKLPQTFAFKPDIITIMLGTNDARSTQWHRAPFLADYRAFVDTLNKVITPAPKLFSCLPMPSWKVNGSWQFDNGIAGNGISNDLIRDSVLPAIRQVASEKGVPIIDVNTPMQAWQAYVADGVHPNAKGQDTIAQVLYRALTAPVTGLPGRESRASRATRPGYEPTGREYTVDGKAVGERGRATRQVRSTLCRYSRSSALCR